MVFGAPLLKKAKISLPKLRPIEDFEPMLRTLGFVKPKETVLIIPHKFKKEVLNFLDEKTNGR